MKHAMQLQADVSEDFRAITVEIDHRVCALERSTELTRGLDGSDEAAVVGARLDGTALGAAQAGASNLGFGVREQNEEIYGYISQHPYETEL